MIIVSGMHRSGTSLLAQLLYEGGADLGDPRTFYRSDRWNPDGYYEQPEIHAVNMPLIAGPWGRLAYFRLPRPETIVRRGRRRANQLRRVIAAYRDRVVKETRFCLTLPAWMDAGAAIDGVVVCLRHPWSVARSLQRRNWIPLRLGYKLWLEHNRRLLTHAAGLPIRFVRYETLMDAEQFRQEIGPVFRFADVDCDDDRLEMLQQQVLKPSLNHCQPVDTPLPPAIQQCWNDLCRRHAEQPRSFAFSQTVAQ